MRPREPWYVARPFPSFPPLRRGSQPGESARTLTGRTRRNQVFHNIDYIFITIKLMQKDYAHLAKCMVPIGAEQIAMSLEERAEHLRKRTRRFTEEEIKAKFKSSS